MRGLLFVSSLILSLLFIFPSFSEAFEVDPFPFDVERHGLFKVMLRSVYIEGDPDEEQNVDLNVTFTAPSQKTIKVPAFCVSNDKAENTSLWEVRFTPEEEGEYSFRAIIDRPAVGVSEEFSGGIFNVKDHGKKGFLCKSSKNNRYLKFSTDEPFFGIGHNVAWINSSDVEIYGKYFFLLKSGK